MRVLVDTNILLRLAQQDDPQNPIANSILNKLLLEGSSIYYSPQAAREFWHVATRSVQSNGLGYSALDASRLLDEVVNGMTLVEDGPGVYHHWRELVLKHNVSGARCHDVNHVATALANGIDAILTFDQGDLGRFADSRLQIIHP